MWPARQGGCKRSGGKEAPDGCKWLGVHGSKIGSECYRFVTWMSFFYPAPPFSHIRLSTFAFRLPTSELRGAENWRAELLRRRENAPFAQKTLNFDVFATISTDPSPTPGVAGAPPSSLGSKTVPNSAPSRSGPCYFFLKNSSKLSLPDLAAAGLAAAALASSEGGFCAKVFSMSSSTLPGPR